MFQCQSFRFSYNALRNLNTNFTRIFTNRPKLSRSVRFSTINTPLKYTAEDNPRTFQEVIFKKVILSYSDGALQQSQVLFGDLTRLDDFFLNRDHGQARSIKTVDPSFSKMLPTYISTMKSRKIPHRFVTVVDRYCWEVLEYESHQDSTLSALELLNAWLQHFYPQFHYVQGLQCYGKLIRQRGREVFQTVSSSTQKSVPEENKALLHLAFVAGIGKKNLFESHEVLSQLATLCDTNPEITYMNWNPFDLAVVCLSFFKGGINMDSKRFLLHISETLCQILSRTLAGESEVYNSQVVISLLKMLRQANYVEANLLRLLSELILSQEHEDKVRDIAFLTNIVSAFTGPGKLLNTMVKEVQRIEYLVMEIMQEEEGIRLGRKTTAVSLTTAPKPESLMKSRLKDISRWLWATASLGYQIMPEAYQADLTRRFFSGEFTARTGDAVDALLGLAIMNHYLDGIVMKVLHSHDFLSALRVKCLQRHKGRFGLFLTSLKIERNDLWRQLSSRDVFQLMEIVGPSKSETQGWSSLHLPVMKKRDYKSVMHSGSPGAEDFKPHSNLLNQCMDALNSIFTIRPKAEKSNSRNDNRRSKNTVGVSSSGDEYQSKSSRDEFSQTRILQGYAVPYLHIPGIKVILPDVGKELYLEVVEDETISPGLQEFKFRLMSKMGYVALRITRDEIKQCPDLPAHLKLNVNRSLNLTST